MKCNFNGLNISFHRKVMAKAYSEYTSQPGEDMPLEQWCELQVQQCVQFDYWLKTLSLEIVLLLFVREEILKIIPCG